MKRRDFLLSVRSLAIAAIVGPLITEDTAVVESESFESKPDMTPEPYTEQRGAFASYFLDDEQHRRHYAGEL